MRGSQPIPVGGPPANRHPDRVANRYLLLWVVGVLLGIGLALLLFFAVLRPMSGPDPTQPGPGPAPQTPPTDLAAPRGLSDEE